MPGSNGLLLGLLIGALPSILDARNLSQRLVSCIFSISELCNNLFFSIFCFFHQPNFFPLKVAGLLLLFLIAYVDWSTDANTWLFLLNLSSLLWSISIAISINHLRNLSTFSFFVHKDFSQRQGGSSWQPSSATASSQTTTPGYDIELREAFL